MITRKIFHYNHDEPFSCNLIKYFIIGFVVIVFLSACSLDPRYNTPSAPIRTEWNVKQTQNTGKLVNQMSWRDFFVAPELQSLIRKGLDNNRDLRQAALNIKVARAQYRISEYLLPDIEVTGNMTQQQIAVNNFGSGAGGFKVRQFALNIGTTAFEVDVFGRLGSLKEAVLQEYFATEEAAQTVKISLIAEIANAYMILMANKQQLYLSEQTLNSQRKSHDLISRRYKAGVSSKLDLSRAETILQTAMVDYATRTRFIAQNQNALELLVGTKLADSELKGTFKDLPGALKKINSGLPSDLLLNRPDIRKAEHTLRAANANIGAARAAFFPSLTLTATTGLGSKNLSGLFDSASHAWIFSPQLTMPIFTWGRNQANLDVAKLRKEISILQYEHAIQTAFREVSDALIAREALEKELSAQLDLVKSSKEAEYLANVRYEKGVDNYLTVLDAVRSSYSAEQELIAKYLARLSNFITLYAALGGGQIDV